MRLRSVFATSFLDGFSMAGFLQRLPLPGQYTRLLEPPADHAAWSPRVFEMGAGADARISLSGDLHCVPEHALHEMLQVLEQETESRRGQSLRPASNLHGAS